jgi:hypothetical protein
MNFAFLTRVARIDCHEAASSDRTLSKTLKARHGYIGFPTQSRNSPLSI